MTPAPPGPLTATRVSGTKSLTPRPGAGATRSARRGTGETFFVSGQTFGRARRAILAMTTMVFRRGVREPQQEAHPLRRRPPTRRHLTLTRRLLRS